MTNQHFQSHQTCNKSFTVREKTITIKISCSNKINNNCQGIKINVTAQKEGMYNLLLKASIPCELGKNIF